MRSIFFLVILSLPLMLSAADDSISYRISCDTSPNYPPVQGNLLEFNDKEPAQIHTARGDWNTNGSGWFEQTFEVKVSSLEQPQMGATSLLLFELAATQIVPHGIAKEEDAPAALHFLFSRESGKGLGFVRLKRGSQMQVTCNKW